MMCFFLFSGPPGPGPAPYRPGGPGGYPAPGPQGYPGYPGQQGPPMGQVWCETCLKFYICRCLSYTYLCI